MKNSKLNDFEKNFWISNNTYRDDRDNIVIKISLPRSAERGVFGAAIRKAVMSFPNLNMRVVLDDNGEPYFREKPKHAKNVIELEDLQDLHSCFDLSSGEAVRYYCENDNTVYIATHHIYFDEESMKSFVEVICGLINDRNFVSGKTNSQQIEISDVGNAYWKGLLNKGCEPCAFFAPEKTDEGIGVINRMLDGVIMGDAERFMVDNRISMTATVIFVTAIMIRKILSEDDMIISTPVTMRAVMDDSEVRCGCRINVLPLPVSINSKGTIIEQLKKTTSVLWSGIEHRDYSFDKLLRELNIDRELGLYDVMAEYIDEDVNKYDFVTISNKTARLDLSLSLIKRKNKYFLHIEYDKCKITNRYAHVISEAFELILKQIISSPNGKISSLRMCSEGEERKLLEFGKGKLSDCDVDIIGRIIKAAKKNPDKTAIIHNDRTITYKELLLLVANIKAKLSKNKIKKGIIVGIHLERSIEYIATQLALIAIGAPFVPLDMTLPKDRIREIVQESGLSFIITDSVTEGNGAESLDINSLIKGRRKTLKAERIGIKDLAYVIFTSGSTGKPKGVMINRLGFANHQDIMIDYLGLSNTSVVAQSAPISFDISVWQLICPLMVGGIIDIVDKETLIDPQKMLDKIRKDKISVLETVPSLINEYLDFESIQNSKTFNGVKVISTGEGIARKIATKWNKKYPENPLINAYGPAEASDDTHFFEISSEAIVNNEDIPIGVPLNNIGTVVLDCDGQLCPLGIVGEICIYGPSLANGYINNETKTAESFIYSSCVGERIYTTGDYGRWIEYGVLGYNGRRDNQIKIRGQRAELGEIEEKIRQILNLEKVSVILRDFGNNKRLVCFIESTNRIDGEELKRRLSEKLPCYMVPWSIITVDCLPTNNNGKLDRKKLEGLYEELEESNSEKDEDDISGTIKEICDVWGHFLGCKVKKESDFFELGGDSLLCLTVSNELNKRNIHVGPRDIMRGRTPAEIAKTSKRIINASCVSCTKIPKYTDIQKIYLELSGKYKDNAEIQAGVYSNERLTSKNVISALGAVQRLVPFLKMGFSDKITALSSETDINNELEKQRKLLSLDKLNAIAVPFSYKATIKILFVIHHFYFDIYSWEILCNALNRVLEGETDVISIEDDRCLKIALLNESHKRICFKVAESNKCIKTKRNSFRVYRYLNNFELLKKQILLSLHDARVIDGDSIVVLNEKSIRNENINATANSIGWGTYYEPQGFDFKTSKFYETDEKCNIEISDTEPLFILNVVAENQTANNNLDVMATDIQRNVPFVEIDIVVGVKYSTFSLQDNIGISQSLFKKICSILDSSSDELATPAQRGFLIGSDFGKNGFYREQIAIKVPTAKREEIAKRIIEITQKSQALRTTFYEKNGEIFQKYSSFVSPVINNDNCLESEIKERFEKERKLIPDLRKKPPIRYLFVDTIESLYLCISYNHVLLDGDSIFFLLDYITGKQELTNGLPVISSEAQSQKEAISYWEEEMRNTDPEVFRVFKSAQTTKYKKEQKILNENSIQLIYSLAKEYQTTPATIVQSIFNCWALQYFNKDTIGYGFVYDIRNGDTSINNMAPSTNTVPYMSSKKEIKDNIAATIAKNREQSRFKDYPLKDILSLSRRSLISFDIILTITTRNLNTRKYDIVYTHEETGYPLAIDFDFSDGELIMTAVADEGVKPDEIISSFMDFTSATLSGQNSIKRTVYSEDKNERVVLFDAQKLQRIVSKVVSTDVGNINPDRSFIENGGDSILALRLRNELNEIKFDASVGAILSSRTLTELVPQIREIKIEKKERHDGVKAVVRKILCDYANGYEANYHEQAAFRLSGSYSPSAMDSACNNIGRYIKTLRTFYYGDEIKVLEKSRVKYIDVDATCNGLGNAVKKISKYDLSHPFDPESNELLRVYTINDKDNRHWYLFLSFSTLVTDGWSFSSLLKAFMRLYEKEKTYQIAKRVEKTKLKCQKAKNSISQRVDIGAMKILVNEKAIDGYRKKTKREITDCEVFEECIVCAMKAQGFNKMLRYENNRYEAGHSNFNTIGCFAKYEEIITSNANGVDEKMLAFIFENYPKDAENDLRDGRVREFQESGNWRLALLPPKVSHGIFIEKQKNEYVVECYYEKSGLRKRRIANNILTVLKKVLEGAKQ